MVEKEGKNVTAGLFVTNINEPEFTEDVLNCLRKKIWHITSLSNNEIRKNLETGLIRKDDDISNLIQIQNRIVLNWDMDYELKFKIKLINGNS